MRAINGLLLAIPNFVVATLIVLLTGLYFPEVGIFNYVPFFDQFDQSMSFWSPDSTQIVYAGTSVETGERGVFTHQIGSVVPPLRLVDGELGVWSPDAAGSAATSAL